MEQITKKSELIIGDLIQTRDGQKYIYMGRPKVYRVFVQENSKGFLTDGAIQEELMHIGEESEFDVMKVYRAELFLNMLSYDIEKRTCIFDREENEKAKEILPDTFIVTVDGERIDNVISATLENGAIINGVISTVLKIETR